MILWYIVHSMLSKEMKILPLYAKVIRIHLLLSLFFSEPLKYKKEELSWRDALVSLLYIHEKKKKKIKEAESIEAYYSV